LGVELAAVVLIFTGQAWNLAFSFYHSLRTLPKELREVANIFQFSRWQQFKGLELPVATIGLVWNSILSWAGGWFFLMACEMFTLGGRSFQRPGLGSYLKTAAGEGDVRALLYGLGTLVFLIVLLDKLLWRPLVVWAERFKMESTASPVAVRSLALELLSRSRLLTTLSGKIFLPLGEAMNRFLAWLSTLLPREAKESFVISHGRRVGITFFLFVSVLSLSYGAVRSADLLIQLRPADFITILEAVGATFLRVVVAQLLALVWVLPVGVAIGLNFRLAQVLQPIVQVAASIPATSLFPGFLLLMLALPGGLNLAAISLMLFASQWYLLFNIIAGAMAIPRDLKEVSAMLQVRGVERWRSLIPPLSFPIGLRE
jgi:NitT/TauT family transport system permease protein